MPTGHSMGSATYSQALSPRGSSVIHSIELVGVMAVGLLYERQDVLHALSAAVGRVRGGDGTVRVRFLLGDAGLGKTTVLARIGELAHDMRSGTAQGVAADKIGLPAALKLLAPKHCK